MVGTSKQSPGPTMEPTKTGSRDAQSFVSVCPGLDANDKLEIDRCCGGVMLGEAWDNMPTHSVSSLDDPSLSWANSMTITQSSTNSDSQESLDSSPHDYAAVDSNDSDKGALSSLFFLDSADLHSNIDDQHEHTAVILSSGGSFVDRLNTTGHIEVMDQESAWPNDRKPLAELSVDRYPSYAELIARCHGSSRQGTPESYDSSLPDNYIRYREPTETELYDRVEYDMDESDQAFLDSINDSRLSKGFGRISCGAFETVIDKLEKEWFNLMKNLQSHLKPAPFPDDYSCAVCGLIDCENCNVIVFCDGCNMAVHQDCYGVPHVPDGQWLCRRCILSPNKTPSCIFCSCQGGAFKCVKETNDWAHLICALWIPELTIGNSILMEPIENIGAIPKERWKLVCSICKLESGACIQCSYRRCCTAFHVTCARKAGLWMSMEKRGSVNSGGVALMAYCKRHSSRRARRNESSIAIDSLATQQQPLTNKSSIGSETHALGEASFAAPLIAPDYILSRLEKIPCILESHGRKGTRSLITTIARYWALKRGSQHNPPLIGRLQLKPRSAFISCIGQERPLETQAKPPASHPDTMAAASPQTSWTNLPSKRSLLSINLPSISLKPRKRKH